VSDPSTGWRRSGRLEAFVSGKSLAATSISRRALAPVGRLEAWYPLKPGLAPCGSFIDPIGDAKLVS
jgi:hypothetical protein